MIEGLFTTSFLLFWLATVSLFVVVGVRFSRRSELEDLKKWRLFSGAPSSAEMYKVANSRSLIMIEQARTYLASGIGKAHGLIWGVLLLTTIGLGIWSAALKI